MEILLALISVPKFILNLLSLNYIGRLEIKKELLEGRIKLLEDDNKRKEEVYSEAMKITSATKGFLDEKAEKMEKEERDRKQETEKFKQIIKEQKKKISGSIFDITERFFDELRKYIALNKKNRTKIESIKNKLVVNFDDTMAGIFYRNQIDNAYNELGSKAIDTIFEISRTIIEMMKKS